MSRGTMAPMCELYLACGNAFEDQAPLKGKGVVIKEFPHKIIVAVTADGPAKFERPGHMGCTMEPFLFYIWKNGWLVAEVAPDGGPIAACLEDELIEIIGGGGR